MTVVTPEHVQDEVRSRAGNAACARCKETAADIGFLVERDCGALSVLAVALSDARRRIAVGAPGSAPIQLTTSLDALMFFLAGHRSPSSSSSRAIGQ